MPYGKQRLCFKSIWDKIKLIRQLSVSNICWAFSDKLTDTTCLLLDNFMNFVKLLQKDSTVKSNPFTVQQYN
jgi:hypothetical protein